MFEREGLPYAPIVKPEQLFDDPHLVASGGLADLTLDSGETTPVPLLPLLLGGRHLKPRMPMPKIGRTTPSWTRRQSQHGPVIDRAVAM